MNLVPARRRRVSLTLVGALATMLVVPSVLSAWAPAWFVLLWVALYVAGAGTFVVSRLRSDDPRVEFAWSLVTSAIFALIPLSNVLFEADGPAMWAAGAISAFHITNEIAARNYLTAGDWRSGPMILSTALSIATTIQLGWLIGAGVLIICLATLHSANQVREQEEEMRHQRNHDELTGLLSRRGLLDAIDDLGSGPTTMVMLDADRFKTINDTYGYAAGDLLLRALGAALVERLGPEFRVARHGGDEFVAVASGMVPVSDSIVDPVSCKIPYRDTLIDIEVDVSAGVVHADQDTDHEYLMSRAGFAVRASKRTRHGAVSTFDGDLAQQFARALEVWASRGLSSEDALFAVAQQITDGERPVGWELLARWRGADGSIINPDRFLPLLAENGLMPKLNDRMLETAVAFAARFNDDTDAPFVSVNITASHLASPDLVAFVRSLLEEHRVTPGRLMIEITESEDLDALATWTTTARGLVGLGVKLAIDDFGSGYSSIERINQLPVTHLKFDRSLATALSGPFGEIVKGVVRFARATNLGIIAEGIEQAGEFTSMSDIGVELFQGFYFSRPVSLDVAEQTVRSANPVETPSAWMTAIGF